MAIIFINSHTKLYLDGRGGGLELDITKLEIVHHADTPILICTVVPDHDEIMFHKLCLAHFIKTYI